MYGKITYTDVLNLIAEEGWDITGQTPDATTIEKRVGAPRFLVLPLAVIPLIGLVLGLVWVALNGRKVVTVERRLTSARITMPGNEFDVNTREDLEMFFNDHNYRGNVGYSTVTTVGLVATFVLTVWFQLL
jgi:hypothetical protein